MILDLEHPRVGQVTEAQASVLTWPVKIWIEMTRTDFKRVKPFAERLQVKLGPLQPLDF